MVSIQEVQARFPDPMTVQDVKKIPTAERAPYYCVSGAVCLFLGEVSVGGFPSAKRFAEVLRDFCADWETALYVAKMCQAYNDRGDFAAAWAVVGKAGLGEN